MTNNLDFAIIGAQKSATTALFSYLAAHPDIAMPAAKEVPFFTGADTSETAWQTFAEQHYRADAKLRGKATPQYMGDSDVPARIAALFPNIKLIAILRDPIDRARSHYTMAQRRGTEPRSFEAAVVAGLAAKNLTLGRNGKPPTHAKGYVSEADFYLAWGEYGRILNGYLAYFDKAQILVLTTAEIKDQPCESFDRVLTFLGLAPGYRPANLGEVVHRGGASTVISAAVPKKIVNLPLINYLWQCVPDSSKNWLRYWFEQLNVKHSATPTPEILSDFTQQRLAALYRDDIKRLLADFELDLPWKDKYQA